MSFDGLLRHGQVSRNMHHWGVKRPHRSIWHLSGGCSWRGRAQMAHVHVDLHHVRSIWPAQVLSIKVFSSA